MLQFNQVKHTCLERANEILSVSNCLKIWTVTEQLSLKPLWLKAKLLALQEFMSIKDSEHLLELNLEQILDYLGNIYLKSDSELSIFQTGMKWWYEHSECFKENSMDVLMKLLSCVDFNSLDDNSLNEIMIYPDICFNHTLMEILKTVKELKKQNLPHVTDYIREKAQLLYNTNSRMSPYYVTLLMNAVPLQEGRKSFSVDSRPFEIFHQGK